MMMMITISEKIKKREKKKEAYVHVCVFVLKLIEGEERKKNSGLFNLLGKEIRLLTIFCVMAEKEQLLIKRVTVATDAVKFTQGVRSHCS